MQAMSGLEENELLQFCSQFQMSQATVDRARELVQVLQQHQAAEVGENYGR
jgi:predicted transcriptional regulator